MGPEAFFETYGLLFKLMATCFIIGIPGVFAAMLWDDIYPNTMSAAVLGLLSTFLIVSGAALALVGLLLAVWIG